MWLSLRQHQAMPCHCTCAGARDAGPRLWLPLYMQAGFTCGPFHTLKCQERFNYNTHVHMLEQEFAGASRAASCGDAPRCMYTHPGVRRMLCPHVTLQQNALITRNNHVCMIHAAFLHLLHQVATETMHANPSNESGFIVTR